MPFAETVVGKVVEELALDLGHRVARTLKRGANRLGDRGKQEEEPTPPPRTDHNYLVGRRLAELHGLFKCSTRQLANRLQIEPVSLIERIESGDIDLPTRAIEILSKELWVSLDYIDGVKSSVFRSISTLDHRRIVELLRDGYEVVFYTAPDGHEERSYLMTKAVLFKKDENVPACVVVVPEGSFVSKDQGYRNIRDILYLLAESRAGLFHAPLVFKATTEDWKAMDAGRFYEKSPYEGWREQDDQCYDILYSYCDRIQSSIPAKVRKRWSGEFFDYLRKKEQGRQQ